MRKIKPEDVEEAEICIRQRQLLEKLRQFLLDHDADEALLEAVDQAAEDNEQWGVPSVEDAIRNGVIKGFS